MKNRKAKPLSPTEKWVLDLPEITDIRYTPAIFHRRQDVRGRSVRIEEGFRVKVWRGDLGRHGLVWVGRTQTGAWKAVGWDGAVVPARTRLAAFERIAQWIGHSIRARAIAKRTQS